MRLAVFFYADATIVHEDATWLRHLLHAMVQHSEQHSVLLFTNSDMLSALVHPRITFPSTPPLTGLWVRRRTLRRWQQGAQSAGADAIVCVGSQSFRPAALPAHLLLLPGRSPTPKELEVAKSEARGVWVTSNVAKDAMGVKGLRDAVVLRGGPLYPLGDGTFDADALKEHYTDGCEYFLYAGPMNATAHLIGLLKAFSKFKHRQKSSWKLVLLPLSAEVESVAALKNLLATYKYRQDVVLPDDAAVQSKAADFFAAAYAFVQPLPVQPYGHFLREALNAALPIIATNEALHKEVAGNAALYYEGGDEQLLATCLMQVYKDEALRSRLSEAARQAATQWGWGQTAAAAWQSLGGAEK